MPCSYFVREGVPSKLFDSLFAIMKDRYPNNEVEAEKQAVRIWSMTRSDNFKQWFGDWEMEANANDPALLAAAEELSYKAVEVNFQTFFRENLKSSLRGIAEQVNLGNRDKMIGAFGRQMIDIAHKLYPNAEMGQSREVSKMVDENGEPLVLYHSSHAKFEKFRKDKISDDEKWNSNEGVFNKLRFLFQKPSSFGFYFTKELEYVNFKDKNLYPVFLNITKPLVAEANEESKFWSSVKTDAFDGAVWDNKLEVIVYEPNQIKSIDNIGYFSTQNDDIKAMVTDNYYRASRKYARNQDFFSLRTYDVEALVSGKKTMSIRPERLKSGIYQYGDEYYQVINRGLKKITDLKEKPETIRAKSIGKEDIRFMHIEEFFAGKLPMYVYDIKKVDKKDFEAKAFSTEFQGDLGIESGSNRFAADTDIFGKYITAISEHIAKLKSERTRVKGNLKLVQEYSDRIAEQEVILESINENKSIRFLIETGISQLEGLKQYVMKDDATLVDITEGMRLSLAWSQINQIVDLMLENKTEAELEIVNEGRALQSEASNMYAVLANKQNEIMLSMAEDYMIHFGKDKGAWIDENGDLRMRDIDQVSVNTISAAYSSNPLETLLTTLIRARTNTSNEEHYAFLTDADETTARLLGKKDANTRFMTEEYEVEFKDEETGVVTKTKMQGIVTEYSREFYDKYNKLRSKALRGEIKWKEFYEFEQKHFTYNLTAEGKTDFEKYMEDIKADYVIDIDTEGNYIYDEDALADIRKRYDPETFLKHLADSEVDANSGGRWLTKTPKNIPLNPNYTKLTDKQKEYHAWFSNQYMEAYVNSIFDYRVGQTDIDQLIMDFSTTMTEGLGGKAKYIGQSGIDFIKNSFMVTAGITNSKTISRPITGNENIVPVFKPVDEFLPENGSKINPLEVLKKFKAASIAFKNKRQIEEVLNVIVDKALTATKQEQNNSDTDINRSTGGGLGTKNPLNIARRIEYTVKEYLAGTGKDKNTTVKKNIAPGTKGFSLGQTFDSINSFTRFRYMALSPLSAAGNFLMGSMNNLTYASSGQYFNDKELARASFMLKGAPFSFFSKNLTLDKVDVQTKEAKLVAELMYKYNILGDVTEELTYGGSALARFFALQKGGEFLVQGATCLAQMLHNKIELKDGKKGTMLDLYKLNKEGRLEFQEDLLPENSEYRNVEKIHNFFDKVKAVNDKIHGDYRQALLGKKHSFGRMLFMFRTWLPMSIKERFGAEYEHHLLGTQKGRYRSFGALITGVRKDGKWDKDGLVNVGKAVLKLIPFLNKYVKLGGNLSEVDRNNITMAIREVQMMLILTMATAFAKAAMSDDEDDDENNYLRYIYNQGERLNSELSMYFLPSSYNQILKNIIPMTNTLIDAEKVSEALINYINEPEKDIYQRGFRKGDSKLQTRIEQFLPLTRSAQSTWSAFSQIYNQNVR